MDMLVFFFITLVDKDHNELYILEIMNHYV